MNPTSISIALAVGATVAAVLGRSLHQRDHGPSTSVLIAVTFGSMALRMGDWGDWVRWFRPLVAFDLLPWICLVAAAVLLIRSAAWRAVAGAVLGVGSVGVLLWGSVYQRDWRESLADPATATWLIAWPAAIAAITAMHQNAGEKRFSGQVVAWAIAAGAVAVTIAMSGSFTYGVAAGVVAVAMLGGLLAAGRLPVAGALPLAWVTGLTAAYAELDPTLCVTMLAGLVGLAVMPWLPDRPKFYRWVMPSASVAMLMMVSLVSLARFAESSRGSKVPAGYGNAATERAAETEKVESRGRDANAAPATVENEAAGGTMPDPFGGPPGGP